jgi:hypothetical protein
MPCLSVHVKFNFVIEYQIFQNETVLGQTSHHRMELYAFENFYRDFCCDNTLCNEKNLALNRSSRILSVPDQVESKSIPRRTLEFSMSRNTPEHFSQDLVLCSYPDLHEVTKARYA